MKFFIVFAALFAVALAAPVENDAQIVKQDTDVNPDGYHFVAETSDGTQREEEGHLKDIGTEHEAIVVHGSYTYIGKDGQQYTVTYIADENGFQPQGAHLPKA